MNRVLQNERFLFVGIPAIVILFPHLFLVIGGYDRWIMPVPREIGFVENATAIFFFIGGIYCLYLLAAPHRENVTFFRLTIAFIGLSSVWVGLEEISYGQQWLRFTTPEWFIEHNYNRELNIHNLGDDSISHILRTVSYIGVSAVGIIAPLVLYWKKLKPDAASWFYHFIPTPWMIVPSLFFLFANLPKTIIKSLPDGHDFVSSHVYFSDSGEYEEYMFGLWVILYIASVHRCRVGIDNQTASGGN